MTTPVSVTLPCPGWVAVAPACETVILPRVFDQLRDVSRRFFQIARSSRSARPEQIAAAIWVQSSAVGESMRLFREFVRKSAGFCRRRPANGSTTRYIDG